DYYRFYAFFNNVPEKGLDGDKGNPVPVLLLSSPEQARRLATLRKQLASLDARIGAEYDQLKKAEADLLERIPSTLVMEEMPRPRIAGVFRRGDSLSEGEVVAPGVRASLPPLPAGEPANRLGLARWLVDPRHPLTGRVTVNRYWQMLFGTGLVKTG